MFSDYSSGAPITENTVLASDSHTSCFLMTHTRTSCSVPAGVPPLVSRRVLEILTYLARNHSHVANLLLFLEPAGPSSIAAETSPQKVKEKGKAKLVDGVAPTIVTGEPKAKGEIPLILLLKLLNQPLYSRSSAHLEQVGISIQFRIVSGSTAISAMKIFLTIFFCLFLFHFHESAFPPVPSFGLVINL